MLAILTCNTVSATNHTVNPGDNIQDVVDGASDGDNITVNTGTYNENVNVTKNLTIKANGSVTINAGSTGSCFHIYSGGSGSTIQGFILSGATQSSSAGVYLGTDANNCIILHNTMLNNWAGMWIWSSYNQIYDNNISDNYNHGIRLVSNSKYNNIYSNIIKNNNLNDASNGGGITSTTAPDENNNLYLNQIVGNHILQIDWNPSTILYANNNWWGTNTGPSGVEGIVIYTNWLVLGITADPYSINNGQTSTITADLNHNFNGTSYSDISSLGHVKDGIQINFIFTGSPLGTLNMNPAYTLNGNASTIFTANSAGTSHLNATLDSANVHTTSNTAQTPCDIVIASATAHVTLTKTATTTTPNYWDLVTFLITAHNNGPNDAEGVQVTDILPAGITYVDSTSSGTTIYNPTTGIWNIGTLTNGGTDANLNITVNITTTGTITNWANVTAQTTPDYQTFNTTNLTLNTPEAAVIEMTKEFRATLDGPAITTANYLDTIYTIFTYENKGPDATTVQVIDTPSGFNLGDEYWIGYNPDTTTWFHVNSKFTNAYTFISPGDKIWIGLIGTVNQTGLINNTANVTKQDTYHPGPLASATAQINVPDAAVIEMTKEFRATLDGPAITTANYLDTIYAIVTCENKGPNATTICVKDNPSGFTIGNEYWVGFSPDTTTWHHYNTPFSQQYIGFGQGRKVWIGIIGTVTQTGLINNTANVTEQDIYHPGPLASATAQITVPDAAHVTLTKTATTTTPNYWDLVTFLITAHNNGPSNAEGVQVTDILPSGLTYITHTASGTTTYNPTTGIWNIGTLTNGGTDANLNITVNITTTGTITNWANVTAQTTPDYQTFNTTNLTLNTPDAAALELTKSVNNNRPKVHDTILYTLIVQNHGPNAATSVKVTEVLPLTGLKFVGVDSVDYGNYDNGVWNIPNLPADTVAHLVLRFTVESSGAIENKATLTSLTWDPELYPHTSNVTIIPQNSSKTSVNAQNVQKTVGMQKTGMPFAALLLAVFMVFAGLILPKRS
ncbi:DUF11 domain-containing protein [Methanobacterium petrolearium]|uniref:DUF11 domain-containing protein n=2 Tax=Methanobacterium petrolearium TaxID=710190 RepID=UPI001AE41D57|nr:DUF11 domain-containing protein [Methanobacterium petrolearium]BDZ71151.1 hypothetical protein GCM10025861_16680 [Methanobacterium petrolearium]